MPVSHFISTRQRSQSNIDDMKEVRCCRRFGGWPDVINWDGTATEELIAAADAATVAIAGFVIN